MAAECILVTFVDCSESIFGYKDLRINIYCAAGHMTTYVNVAYTDKVTPQKCDGVSVSNFVMLLFKDC